MKIHEFQGKEVFKSFSIPAPRGYLVDDEQNSSEVLKKALADFNSDTIVVKAQIHAGGRGKGGGVKVCKGFDDALKNINKIMGMQLVTHQTGSQGQKVRKIYLEEAFSIKKEYYCAITLDRNLGKDVFMVSTEGGMEIEKVAEDSPDKIVKTWIDPLLGMKNFQARKLAFGLNFKGDAFKEAVSLFLKLYNCYKKTDATLVEINPLVLTTDEKVLALDAKLNFDGNALYRQQNISAYRDFDEEDPTEVEADKFDLNYIKLDGNVGCMVNGAGLAMGTMDLVKLHGGNPANFLDVGGGATKEAVAEAFKIILSDDSVKAVLINIFGGIVSCATIAEGIIGAVQEVGVTVPVVVRFEGNNSELGRQTLKESGLNIIPGESLIDAAEKAVAAAGGSK